MQRTRIHASVLVFSVAATLVLGSLLLVAEETAARRATIKPTLVRLTPGAEQQFKAILVASRLLAATAPKQVSWAVNDVPGGNSEIGTIDASGLYRAPARPPKPREVIVHGQVEGAANRHVWATVVIGDQDPSYRLSGSWSEPTATGRLKKPHGISIDAQGHLLIADQGAHRIFRYTKDGKFVNEIGLGRGSEPGNFTDPRYATTDAAGNIFVTDVKGDRPRLQMFSPDGRVRRVFGEKGTKPGHILRGHGLAFDRQGRLYVTDVDNMRVSIFDPDGKFVKAWGREGINPGEFNAPHGLYLDPNDDVFVNGYYGPTQKFTPDGVFLLGFAFGDPPDGPVYFHSITGDRWGNVYVTVRTRAGYEGALERQTAKKISIAKYNNNGDHVANLSLSVKEHTESWAAVDRDGTVYALFNSRDRAGVEIFSPE
jgi:DNA-binding beta-propeller fold protein YncE